jgi:hypothetical protein
MKHFVTHVKRVRPDMKRVIFRDLKQVLKPPVQATLGRRGAWWTGYL